MWARRARGADGDGRTHKKRRIPRHTSTPTKGKRGGSRGPGKRPGRPELRHYTLVDLDRARDRVAAAERRVESDRTNKPHRGRAGLQRARRELRVIESNLRERGLF